MREPGSGHAGIRRAVVVAADGAVQRGAADEVDLRLSPERGATGVYLRYLDQEVDTVIGPVPVMQWLTAVPAPWHPFRKVATRARSAVKNAADKAHLGLGVVAIAAGSAEEGGSGKVASIAGSVRSKAESLDEKVTKVQDKIDSSIQKAAAKGDKVTNKLTPKFLKPSIRAWGTRFIPRLGSEVLVAHYLGRPDLPVIIGALFTTDLARRFPPDDSETGIVPADDRPLQQPDDGKAVARAVSAKGRNLSYLDSSLARGDGERPWARNMILFDDREDEDGDGDGPAMVLHAEGDLVIDVRGYLDVDPDRMKAGYDKRKKGGLRDMLPYRFGKYFHTVGGTYRNVVKDWTCTTVLGHAELRTQGDALFQYKDLDFTLALNSLSSVAWAAYGSVEWGLSARFTMPTLTDCTVGAIKGLHILEILKPKATLDHDHQGTHMVLKVLDHKQTESKTETVKNALELAVKDTTKSPAASLTGDVELRLALKRKITDGTHTRDSLIDLKIAKTCTEQASTILEI